MVRTMFRDPSFNKEVVKAILQQWKEYTKFRKQRADVLWIHHKRSFQGEWLVDEQDKAEGVKELPPELIFEPSVPVMSLENLPWVPSSDDWISSVMALDAAEPWRNCWMEQPHRHPFNTMFLPCNPTVCIFVPQGQTPQSVGSSIVIDDCVAPREVAAGLDRDWNRPPVALEASHGAASGTSSAAAIYHVHPRHSTSVEFGFAGLCCGYVDFHWCHTDFCGCCVDCYRDLSVGNAFQRHHCVVPRRSAPLPTILLHS
ncbi:hypothetical protein Pcac1_g28113 [Phytophthora cactorum]|nr:hypothetical protein Pcac1_g28113 [Phytophthora cactorum]